MNKALAGYNTVLPNPPKSPIQIPMLSSAPIAPTIDFNEILNQFRDELSKSIENKLGVQSKPVGLHITNHTLRILIS